MRTEHWMRSWWRQAISHGAIWEAMSLPRSPREISPVFTSYLSCYLHHFPDRPVRYRLSSRVTWAVTYITSQIAPWDIACLHELLLTSLPRSPREISPVFTSCYLHHFPGRPVRYRPELLLTSLPRSPREISPWAVTYITSQVAPWDIACLQRAVTYITSQVAPWDIPCLHELLLTSLPRSPREISPWAVTYITSQIAPWDIACLHELLLTSLPRSPREISPVFTSCYLHHFPGRPVRYPLSSRAVTYITSQVAPWDIPCLHELLLTSLPRSPRDISPVFTSCYSHHFPDRPVRYRLSSRVTWAVTYITSQISPWDIACLHELLLTSLPRSPREISPVFTSCYSHHFPDRPVRYRLSSRVTWAGYLHHFPDRPVRYRPELLLTSLPRSPREISPVFTSCYSHHFPDRPVRYRPSSRAVTYIASQIAPWDIACLHELLLTSLPRSPHEISPVFTSCYLHRFPDRPVRYRLSSRVTWAGYLHRFPDRPVRYRLSSRVTWAGYLHHFPDRPVRYRPELLLTSLPRSPREISPVFTSYLSWLLTSLPRSPREISPWAVTHITSQIAPWDIARLHELLLTSLPRSPREISPVFTSYLSWLLTSLPRSPREISPVFTSYLSCYLHHFPDRPVRYRLSSRVVTYITSQISPWDIACLHELLLTSLPRSPREISPVFTSCYLHHFPDRPVRYRLSSRVTWGSDVSNSSWRQAISHGAIWEVM